jgi:hypothetical protein
MHTVVMAASTCVPRTTRSTSIALPVEMPVADLVHPDGDDRHPVDGNRVNEHAPHRDRVTCSSDLLEDRVGGAEAISENPSAVVRQRSAARTGAAGGRTRRVENQAG